MPRSLAPIPAGSPIVEAGGVITTFFRLRWQSLVDSFQLSPSVAGPPGLSFDNEHAAMPTTSLFVTRSEGLYRISYYLRKLAADGVASSLTWTWGWTDSGVPLTEAAAALVLDSTLAEQSGSKVVWSDANVDLTGAIAYVSTTPGNMHYRADITVEQL